jgi:hypothetical protein
MISRDKEIGVEFTRRRLLSELAKLSRLLFLPPTYGSLTSAGARHAATTQRLSRDWGWNWQVLASPNGNRVAGCAIGMCSSRLETGCVCVKATLT